MTPTQIENALSYAFGGQQISQIYGAQNLYLVVLELLPKDQINAAALNNLYVTSSSGTLVPLSCRGQRSRQARYPWWFNHQGELPCVTLSFEPGARLCAERRRIRHRLQDQPGSQVCPDSIQGSFQGTAAAFQEIHQKSGHACC